ncbi:hypothetical protein CDL12_08734 [Handroanthus impetiginosus]|uniref:DUF4371 domain-containing protein n=1 Tax=Handroanthus impetiginosus TaxID=429701 RepID=A0A2G9HM47_9LAMI|nr:hypothetical protein CDL12_08734 [Handroanthus impetiginosus]
MQKNLKLTSPDIQKDIVNVTAYEIRNSIIQDLGDDYLAILVDESGDVSDKEQMAVVLRYIDKGGFIMERLLGIVRVTKTTTLSLKSTLENLFLKHDLNGASNMKGELHSLKSLIMKENQAPHYIHCFAHQLQLTLVAIAKNQVIIALFFNMVSNIVNVLGASCKHQDTILETYAAKVAQAIDSGEIQSGCGLNQETNLKRAGSHYASLLNLLDKYFIMTDLLEDIEEKGIVPEKRAESRVLIDYLHSFEFAFSLYMMKVVLGMTNDLLVLLQRKNQDILNTMKQVRVCKTRSQNMRDEGWESLLCEVSTYCNVHGICIPNMNDDFKARGRSQRKAQQISNEHRFRMEIFNQVIDMQLQEMNSRFTEVNSKLLTCIACLSPDDSFSYFNKDRLMEFITFYPSKFSNIELLTLDNQLENYIVDMRSDGEFLELKEIDNLARKLVET